jgi:hypothetical protein
MKVIITVFLVLLLTIPVFSTTPDFSDLDIKIGNVRIPRAFIHAGKDYSKGIYYITLKAKNGIPYFNVHNRKKELLFEELAVLKNRDYKGKAKKFRHWVHREFLRGYEYYRIKVIRPDSHIMAYLLLKDQQTGKKKAEKPEAMKTNGKTKTLDN